MKPTGTPSFVRLAGTVSPAELRTETYDGREVIVIPVVGLVGDVVVQGLTSEGPEFIPAHVLAAAPESWNGRPVLVAHPANGAATANTPLTWQKDSFGQIWNAEFSDNRLRMEIWLDPARAEAVGDEALSVLAKAQAGEMFEVSTGAWVWLTEDSGVSPTGSKYDYTWAVAIPDHLAVSLLAHGGKGACDIQMGCGGMRTMSAAQATAAKEAILKPDILNRLALALRGNALLTALADDSDRDVREALWKALRAVEPGFDWVVEFILDSSTVIYTCYPDNRVIWYSRTYTYANGVATLNDDRTEVRPVTRYEPINVTVTVELAANCSCHDKVEPNSSVATPAHQGKGETMTKVAELAGRLIANAGAPFTDADRAHLEALSEAQLEAMDKSFTPPAEPKDEGKGDNKGGDKGGTPTPTPEPTPAPDTVQLSKAEHANLVQLATREAKRDKAVRATLTAALLAHPVKVFTEVQLAAEPTDKLQQLCALAGIDLTPAAALDYSRPIALATDAPADPRSHTPPDPWKVPAALAASLGLSTTAQ